MTFGNLKPPQHTIDRDKTCSLLKEGKYVQALELAKSITEPWFRCQALAHVARKTDDLRKRTELLKASFAAANEQQEPNRIVSVSAWPLSVLADFGPTQELDDQIQRLSTLMNSEPDPVRRSDGFLSLVFALSNGPKNFIIKLCDELMESSRNSKSWRCSRNLIEAGLLVKKYDKEKAKEMVSHIEKPIKRSNAVKKMESDQETDEEKGLHHSIDYRFGRIDK